MRKVAIRVRRAFVTPFGSAFLGGLVVAALGIIAIGAGWIDSDEGGNATAALAPAPIAPSTASVQSSNGNTINQIYQHDAAGVAFVQATTPAAPPSPFNPFGGGGGGVATGSGFVIDDQGHILTNAHVVDGASKIEVTLGNSDSAQPVHADVVGKDESTDVALLKVDVPSDQLHPLPLGNSSQLKVGDPVVAIGNPFGLDRTATAGIVSGGTRHTRRCIRTTASVAPAVAPMSHG